MSDDDARRARAAARRERMTLRRTTLGAADDDADRISGELALSLVAQLTRESWAASGQAWPEYAREEMPCRLVPGRRS